MTEEQIQALTSRIEALEKEVKELREFIRDTPSTFAVENMIIKAKYQIIDHIKASAT